MKKFDTRVYSVADFLEWHNNNLLELSPKFQRRSVWSQSAKSYLIDTIIRGKPMPKMIIAQRLSGSRTIREVVDGQQRLRSILEFIEGHFRISKAHNKEYAGFTFDRLPDNVKKDFLQYELGVDLVFDMSYADILDIFARINTYTVTLNTQEKRNAKYVGYFKQTAYEYGFKYVEYFLQGNVLVARAIARMAEAELSAELFVALIGAVQTNKNTGSFYDKLENEAGDLEQASQRFDTVMSYVGAIYSPDDLAATNWSRIHLFYTLFTSIAHCLYGLKGLDPACRATITQKSVGRLRVALDDISQKYDGFTLPSGSANIPDDYKEFIDFSRRRTTDTAARVGRANFVCRILKTTLS
jgi:hypothetical protein